MPKAPPYIGRLEDYMAQDIAARKLANEYLVFARSIGVQEFQDEIIVVNQWQLDQLAKWWKEHAQ